MSGEAAFSTTDFARARYGRVMQLAVAVISIFYMYIYIVSELTSLSNIYANLVGVDIWSDDSKPYTTGLAVSVCVVTCVYSSIAGLPASIATDKFQG
jgi:Na+/proline symporter